MGKKSGYKYYSIDYREQKKAEANFYFIFLFILNYTTQLNYYFN